MRIIDPHIQSKTNFNFASSFITHKSAVEKDGLSELPTTRSSTLRLWPRWVRSEILVNLLDNKLPKNMAEKCEETLDQDDFPKIDDLYKFLYKITVCQARLNENIQMK